MQTSEVKPMKMAFSTESAQHIVCCALSAALVHVHAHCAEVQVHEVCLCVQEGNIKAEVADFGSVLSPKL